MLESRRDAPLQRQHVGGPGFGVLLLQALAGLGDVGQVSCVLWPGAGGGDLGQRHEAVGLVEIQGVPCLCRHARTARGALLGQQTVAVPGEVGERVGRGAPVALRFGCPPFGDAPAERVVGIGPVVRPFLARVVDAHGSQLVLGIPVESLAPVFAALFLDAVAPGVVGVAVFLPDGKALALAGGPQARVVVVVRSAQGIGARIGPVRTHVLGPVLVAPGGGRCGGGRGIGAGFDQVVGGIEGEALFLGGCAGREQAAQGVVAVAAGDAPANFSLRNQLCSIFFIFIISLFNRTISTCLP
ncbi:hypothetical protein [Thauera butanivorans]|uniref:hypothetical protein n=1 Tax=Thauera butanivorans TaxID=86174 RepID=UPI0012FA6DFE|nr:hypothetical protein [Thauera butanivorans]